MSTKAKDAITYALTDQGNAERFAAQHGESARYVEAWGKWLAWDGSRWKMDHGAAVMQMAKRTVKCIIHEAEALDDADKQKAVANHWLASQSAGRLKAVVELAKSEQPFPISHESLDADPWLLNCENGILDLTTGDLLPHEPGRLMTLTTGVEYPPEAGVDAPVWTAFLERIFDGDAELIRFVQRLAGVSLVGVQREHLLPVFHGSGANGKSVFIGALQHALGDYTTIAPPGLLMASRSDRHPTELAALFRKRLVVVSETKDTQRLDEGLVKAITGGDMITARRMREDFWQFEPSHLALVVTNHKPVVQGIDHGLWRRLRLVPFGVTIPPEERDSGLPEKLQREAPAILRWMVEGCLAWQRHGLSEPTVVMTATDEYRTDSDVLGRWLEEECFIHAPGSMKAGDAFSRYQRWCEQSGEDAMKRRSFGEQLKAKFDSKRTNQGWRYLGVSLGSAH